MLLRLILKKGVDNRLVQISKLKMVIKLDFCPNFEVWSRF